MRELSARGLGIIATEGPDPAECAYLDALWANIDVSVTRTQLDWPSLAQLLKVFHEARAALFTEAGAASLSARRPYDLRHAAVSTWLNAGVLPGRRQRLRPTATETGWAHASR